MAELAISRNETPGILKEIDEGAIDLVFQAIQEDIYSFPIKSFVREAISNGLDAVVERDIYRKIQEGTPQDAFYRQEQDNKLLKDSSFDESYYTSKYLSDDSRVYVRYDMPEGLRRHVISIKDYGVGLGGSRLRGFFRLGYSSKRNLKAVFGKFGSGAKAGLATGVDYFLMKTVYNGYSTSFMIFKTDYEAITPKTSASKVEEWTVKMTNGDTAVRSVYWEPSIEENSVTIELEVKPHNKDSYFQAVIEQFQHFNGKVQFDYKDNDNWVTNYLNDKPIYESENLLIPTRSSYHSPVILVDGISYGLISWAELELEHRAGIVALKVKATDIDITQSRESLKWTEKTKKVILESISKAKTEATEYTSKRLELTNEYDLFEIIDKYSNISTGTDSTMKIFSQFLNMSSVKPKYTFNPKWFGGKTLTTVLDSELFDALFYSYSIKEVSITITYENKAKINSYAINNFNDFLYKKVIFSDHNYLGPQTANYILNEDLLVDSIIYIRPDPTKKRKTSDIMETEYLTGELKTYARELFIRQCDIYLDKYEYEIEEVEPEEGDDIDGEEVKISLPSLAKLRRQNAEVLYRYGSHTYSNMTVKISHLKKHFEGKNVIICTQEYRAWGKFLSQIDSLMNPYYNTKIIYVAKDMLREFLPYGTFVTDYLRKYDPVTKELAISKELYFYNTLKKIEVVKDKYAEASLEWYDHLIEAFNPDLFKPIYLGYSSYECTRYTDSKIDATVNSFLEDLDLVDDLKLQKESSKIIKETTKACFKVSTINNIDTYDKAFVAKLEETLNILMPIKDFIPLMHNMKIGKKQLKMLKLLINTLNNK